MKFLARWRRAAATLPGQGTVSRSTFLQKRQSKVALIAAVLVAGIGISHSLWSSGDSIEFQGNSVGLDHYALHLAPIELSKLSSNASGITYNYDTDTLFTISNSPTYIVEMDKEGVELRQIALEGFHDTEDLTYLGDNRFAIVEERIRSVVIVDVNAQTASVRREAGRSITLPAVEGGNNKGFEGIAYDPDADSLFVVNEDEPRQLLRIDGFVNAGERHVSVSHPWDMEDNSLGKRDLSGVHFDVATGHLLVLSDESRALTETTLTGDKVSRLSLSRNRAGLDQHVPQAEGVAMDHDGQLYILSEPNLLYLLRSD